MYGTLTREDYGIGFIAGKESHAVAERNSSYASRKMDIWGQQQKIVGMLWYCRSRFTLRSF